MIITWVMRVNHLLNIRNLIQIVEMLEKQI